MIKNHVPNRGDIYLINPNPQSGREIKDPHRFVVVTREEVNKLGIVLAAPITSGGNFSRMNGLTVSIFGHDTTGIVLCNQIRSFDLEERIKNKSAKYIETLDNTTMDEVILKIISIIDPAE